MALSTVSSSTPTSAPKAPSIHARALITWIAIFPIVTLGTSALAPFATEWNPILRSFALSLIVVPAAVYVVVPQLTRLYGKIRRSGTKDSKGDVSR